MKKRPNFLWISVLLLGWLFDFLFWKQPAGINFVIYTVLCVIGGFLILWMDGRRPARMSLALLPFILFFAVMPFIRTEPLTMALGFLLTLFLMGLLAISFTGGRWPWYNLGDYLLGFLKLAGSMLARPISFSSEVRREQAESGSTSKKFNPWPVLRGLVIALPIVAIFAALLAAGDAIFNQELDSFFKLLNLQNLPEFIFRLVYILVAAYALAGVFLHAAERSTDEKLMGEDKASGLHFLGFTEASIVLGSVVLLFLAFVIIQFQYFFGGQAYVASQGFTYSEYARHGFGELVTVAFFSLALILGLSAVAQRQAGLQRNLFSGLSAAIVALVMVMLFSAYQRLVLYEQAYGFSRLRTYTHVVLPWIGLLLIAVVVLEIVRRQRLFAFAVLIASAGFGISLCLVNVDGFIVRQNLQRAMQGQGLDVPYLVSLSSDSVPALLDAFNSPATPGMTRDAVGAVLFCRLQSNSGQNPNSDWRSFNLSRWQANRDVSQVRDRLSQYKITDGQWPLQILTAGNVSYRCFGSGID